MSEGMSFHQFFNYIAFHSHTALNFCAKVSQVNVVQYIIFDNFNVILIQLHSLFTGNSLSVLVNFAYFAGCL